MQDFRQLAVWQKAHALALATHKSTALLPSDERYGLTSQIRRAAVSIAANLAEGCGRGGDGEFARFVQMAMGSASEVEYHLLLARDLESLDDGSYATLLDQTTEVKKMLASLIRRVRDATAGHRATSAAPRRARLAEG